MVFILIPKVSYASFIEATMGTAVVNDATAVLANNFNRDVDQNSILRYVMSDNNIQALDVVPALGFKLNNYLSIGVGLNFSQADFLFTPISGFPSLNTPDVQSHNKANASALGGDLGILLKPLPSTQIGLNYRSSMTYHFNGTSQLESNPYFI